MDSWWALANRPVFLSVRAARPASTRPCVQLHRGSEGCICSVILLGSCSLFVIKLEGLQYVGSV